MNSFQLFSLSVDILMFFWVFLYFVELSFLISLLNLILRLQTLHTELSSKLWYYLLAMELSILGNYQQNPNKINETSR